MIRRPRPRLALRGETLRALLPLELAAARGGVLATSEANDTWPCPGEYSYLCKP